jgi:hypothetical protein
MKDDFNEILDECIDRINRGEGIESCLADYPDYAERLRSLLHTIVTAREAYSFTPSRDTKMAFRQRFNAAIEDLEHGYEEQKPLFGWSLGWSRVWVTVAAVLIIAVIGYFGIKPAMFSGEPITQPGPSPMEPAQQPEQLPVTPSPQPEPSPVLIVAQPNPDGNFVFLISDDINAIADFESVNVSVSKISLLRSGDSGQLIEFEPELGEVDLTRIQGDKTQEIWRGNIPEGEYDTVSIQVSDVRGILKETGDEVEIKLPSQRLHISKRFQVSNDELTTFTYDLTVIAAGGPENTLKYILKPQVDQSGADHKPIKSQENEKKEKPNNK